MNTQTQPQLVPNSNHNLVAIRIIADLQAISVESQTSPIIAWQIDEDGCNPVTAQWGLIDESSWTSFWDESGECTVTCDLSTGKTWGPLSRYGFNAFNSVEECAKELAEMIVQRVGNQNEQGGQQ